MAGARPAGGGDYFDPRVKSRALGVLWLCGAAVGSSTIVLPHDPVIIEWVDIALAAFASVVAVSVLLPGRLRNDRQVHAMVALSTLVLTVGVWSTQGTATYEVIYLWSALYAFYFFSLRAALAHLAFIGVCFAGILVIEQPMNGITRWLLAIGTPLVAGLVVSRLIATLKARTMEVAEVEQRRRVTIESAHDPFLSIDSESRIVDWNEAAERLFGWSREVALGRSMPDLLLPASERAEHLERRDALLASGFTGPGPVFETVMVARDGREIPVEIRITVIAHGAQRYFSTFIRDLTERQRREEEQARRVEVERGWERDRRIAETLQRTLLPDGVPELPGLGVAARYIPAAPEAKVGGDWYDVIRTPGGEIGLAMGDVAGKGLAAASAVGWLRSALRAYALEGEAPSMVLERLNRLLFSEPRRTMSTLVYAVFDPSTGVVHWASAGHPPPLVVAPDRAQPLDGHAGVPLGTMPHALYPETASRLDRGETLLLYTDGLIERPGEPIDAGLERLAATAHGDTTEAHEMCERVISALVPARGAGDDVAVLALANPVPADRFEVDLDPEPESLVWVRQLVRRFLRDAGADANELFELVLACDEACTNVVEHAHAASARLRLEGSVEDGQVEFVVRDRGQWRPKHESDHGRGIALMRALVDSIDVETGSEGTTVRLRRRLGALEVVA